jgi:branched-chain amino acid transport system permease protein
MLGGFELFREFEQYRMLVFGVAMVAVVILRPRGLVSRRTPSVTLGASPVVATMPRGEPEMDVPQ